MGDEYDPVCEMRMKAARVSVPRPIGNWCASGPRAYKQADEVACILRFWAACATVPIEAAPLDRAEGPTSYAR